MGQKLSRTRYFLAIDLTELATSFTDTNLYILMRNVKIIRLFKFLYIIRVEKTVVVTLSFFGYIRLYPNVRYQHISRCKNCALIFVIPST